MTHYLTPLSGVKRPKKVVSDSVVRLYGCIQLTKTIQKPRKNLKFLNSGTVSRLQEKIGQQWFVKEFKSIRFEIKMILDFNLNKFEYILCYTLARGPIWSNWFNRLKAALDHDGRYNAHQAHVHGGYLVDSGKEPASLRFRK
ncbi:hypothetical protein AVEN_257344-1 [Araneus ventricosus]|uniref:Uncharacterized protein n=1 Tax=Araneus ventricosus TaxID=182803 RepID=A0A4Y2C9I1_ARAVE|nr:hypothetical protein AVEN_257344-1 [Araneus ventricosus]